MERAGASEGRVISESEHQKGKVIPLCKLFKGRVTPFPEFFNEDGQVAQKRWYNSAKKGLEKRVLSSFGSGIHPSETSFQTLLLGWFSCSSCVVYVASAFGSVNFS